jgi:DNA-binding winged helix-turn-helix (wHTH) protein/tetratricopeptide (TPR) repeat protein
VSKGSTFFEFGPFRLDPAEGLLVRDGRPLPLTPKAFDLLVLLVENSGRLLTKEELMRRLWPDSFVEEANLAQNVSTIRKALALSGNGSDGSGYIETVPKRGYRFVAEVQTRAADDEGRRTEGQPLEPAVGGSPAPQSAVEARREAPPARKGRKRSWLLVAAALVATAALGAFWLFEGRPALSFSPRESVLVADFENQTGDARFDQALRTAFVVSLQQSRQATILPQARVAAALKRMGKSETDPVTPAIAMEICQREGVRGLIAAGITRTGSEYALTAQLIDPKTGEAVRSYLQRVSGEDGILNALDAIALSIRRDLGESIYQIQRADRPLPQVTTASLSALQLFSDGRSLWHGGKHREGMARFESAVKEDPGFAMAHAALGNGYYSFVYNEPELGRQEYEKALALAPRTTERERLEIEVNFAASAGHYEEARRLYGQYLRLYPDDWTMRDGLARLLRTHGQYEEAVQQYRELIRIAPSDAKPYMDMATAYRASARFPEAVAAYEQAFQLEPSRKNVPNINREYGFTLVENGDEGRAVELFTSQAASSEQANGLGSLAILDLFRGRCASARSRFLELLALDRRAHSPFAEARTHFMLATLAETMGDTRERVRQLDAAHALLKDFGPKVEYGSLIGQEYARAGEVAKAQSIESTITPLVDSRNAEQAGYVSLLRGEIARARKDWSAAASLLALNDPSFGDSVPAMAAESLANAHREAGDLDASIRSFEDVIRSPSALVSWEPQQRWVLAHYTLANLYREKGDSAKARQTLGKLLEIWKDADPTIPLLQQAKGEYAKLP